MKPTKVLILITKSNWGGAQRYVFDLATRLPKDKFTVEVMAGGDGPLITKLKAAGVTALGDLPIGRDIRFMDDVKAFFKLISILREKKPDVLHVNSSKIGGLGALAGRLSGVKRIIFTAHGWAFNEDRSFAGKAVIRLLYWFIIMMSHQTIAVSEAAKKQIRNWPYVQDKVAVIHNGIAKETGFARKNARLELTRLDLGLKKALEGVSEANLIWIGTMAELHHIKGYKYAIQAVADCISALKASDPKKHVVYTILGNGEEREALQSLIVELKLEKHIFLMGHVDGAASLASAFDIFLLASLSEGLSYVLLEAGAASLPVVATAVGGIPEVIDDMESGVLVQPKSARELAHALSFMIEHPAERKAYGKALHEKTLKEFSLEEMISKTADAYVALTSK